MDHDLIPRHRVARDSVRAEGLVDLHQRQPPRTLPEGRVAIEERSAAEVTDIQGAGPDGVVTTRIVSPGSPAANPAFDVTPARLVTGLVTERGVAEASETGLLGLFPERAAA